MGHPQANEVKVRSAYDEAVLKSYPLTTETAAFAALESAQRCYQARASWLPAHERVAILERFAALVSSNAEALAQQAAREGGKPLVDSRVEIQRGVEGVKVAIGNMWHHGGQEIPMGVTPTSMGRMAMTFREPRGVVLAVSAFNHPFNLIIHQVVPALAVGCPVVVKPARTTPMSCEAVVQLLYDAGLPHDRCQMVLCDNQVTEKLVRDPRVAFLSFVGSARVGWHLRSLLASGASCALEHGGVAPVIVDSSANVDEALPLLAKGGYYHAGQVCVSVQRIYAQRSVVDGLVDGLVSRVKALKVGDPNDVGTEVGPLIAPKEVDRVHGWVQAAAAAGGKVLCGGEKLSSTCYAPTVVLDPPDDVQLSCEEVFGPVVAVYSCDDVDGAVARANGPDVYFQAAVFTQQLDVALRLSRQLKGMAVMVNDHTAFRVDWMPFGGHRQSGLGVGGIGYSMHEMTLERMVVFRSGALA